MSAASVAAEHLVTADLLAEVRAGLAGARRPPADQVQLAEEVRRAAVRLGIVLGTDDLASVTARVRAELWGVGPLEPLLADPSVTDVLVNPGDQVYVERAGRLVRVPVRLGGEAEVRALALRLASAAGRRLDDAAPWVDARLPGGLRLHAILPPLSPHGTCLSLRVLRRSDHSLTSLGASGSIPPAWQPVLRALVTRRASFLVTGGTGVGKTTLLAAMLTAVPGQERLVLVEDIGELGPQHPHVVRLEARAANVEGRGEVGLQELVRQALRMRPDRLVVGECRGPEVRDLLAALNTGHAGGCGTLHANTAAEVPARLEALGSLAGLAPESVRLQSAAALDAVVHLRRERGLRRVWEIATVEGAGGDRLDIASALIADPDPLRPGRAGPGWPVLADLLGLPEEWP